MSATTRYPVQLATLARLFVTLLCLMLFVNPVSAAPDPLTCAGYAEPRVFADSQAWWMQTAGKTGTENGHVHTDVCFPFRQHVKGIVPLDIRLVMHNNPGKLDQLAVQVWNGGTGASAKKSFSPALVCATDCEFWVHLEVDTTKHPYDGWQEWRIRPRVVEPDGKQLIGSTSYQAYLENGKPIKNYRDPNFVQGKGWYSAVNYAQARVTAGYTYGAAVSGKWAITIACDASNLPVTGCLATIDPNFHLLQPGITQHTNAGPFKGTVTIDTTTLANGPHRLVIRTDVNAPTGSTLSGVLNLPFTVQN